MVGIRGDEGLGPITAEMVVGARACLCEEQRDLPDHEVAAILARRMRELDHESGDVLGAVTQTLGAVAPTAGRAIGSLFGPAGGVIGGAIGSLVPVVTNLVAGRRRRRSRRGRKRPRRAAGIPQRAAKGGAPAPGRIAVANGNPIAALIQLLSHPTVMQAFGGLLMGASGRRNVAVGNRRLPVGAVTNLMQQLLTQASAQADIGGQATEAIPDYLIGENGEPLTEDIASPVERAAVVWRLLMEESSDEPDDHEQIDLGDDLFGEHTGDGHDAAEMAPLEAWLDIEDDGWASVETVALLASDDLPDLNDEWI